MRSGAGVPPAVARAFLRSAQDRLCPCRFTAKMAVPQRGGYPRKNSRAECPFHSGRDARATI